MSGARASSAAGDGAPSTAHIATEFTDELCAALREALCSPQLSIATIQQRGNGYSWETYLVEALRENGSVERFAVKRAPQAGLLSSYDVQREVELLEAARTQVGCPVPRVITHRSAAPPARGFYVMEMVVGVVPMPWDIKKLFPEAAVRRRIGLQLADIMARLHSKQVTDLHLPAMTPPASATATGIVEVAKWHDTYRESTATRVPVLDLGFAWLKHRAERVSGRLALVHNDLRVGNVIVDDGNVAAVLDWETAEFSDPSADLAKFNLPTFRGRSTLASGLIEWSEFLAAYEQASGWRPTQAALDYWTVLEIVKAAVGGLRGSFLFESGRTNDLRYANMGWQTHHQIKWLIELFENGTWGR